MGNRFVHIVNFWLKKNITQQQVQQFEEGITSLGTIKTVQIFHLGKPASTRRPVIDSSYDYCLLCIFNNQQDHDTYQVHPIHDRFRETCSHLWGKVLIYDSLAL